MDSGSPATRGKSGGKIYKRRPTATRNTPYDRPTTPLQPNNTNWLNALVFPAKFVSSGVTKLLSSVWNPVSLGSHYPSSETGSDYSEGGIEDDYEHDENFHDDDAELNQNKGSSSGKSEILYLVEHLLMLEHLSRQECDRLINIINSRVADYTMRKEMDAGPNNPNISNKLIIEARKMVTKNRVGSRLISDMDNNSYGSKSLVTPNRDHHGLWNIQNEMQRLHSKAIELIKPNNLFSLQAPKLGNETVNMASKDMRTTQDDVPTGACSSLPTIKEKYQIAEQKDYKNDKAGDDMNRTEESSDMITEYAEVADFIHASQGSSNTKYPTSTNETDSPSVKQETARTRRYNARRGRPRDT